MQWAQVGRTASVESRSVAQVDAKERDKGKPAQGSLFTCGIRGVLDVKLDAAHCALTRGALTTGANDVANSFSTAVASKTLTHRQAIILALFAEFTGAMVLGSSVTDTVRKKILDVEKFRHDPYVLMLGHKFSKNSP